MDATRRGECSALSYQGKYSVPQLSTEQALGHPKMSFRYSICDLEPKKKRFSVAVFTLIYKDCLCPKIPARQIRIATLTCTLCKPHLTLRHYQDRRRGVRREKKAQENGIGLHTDQSAANSIEAVVIRRDTISTLDQALSVLAGYRHIYCIYPTGALRIRGLEGACVRRHVEIFIVEQFLSTWTPKLLSTQPLMTTTVSLLRKGLTLTWVEYLVRFSSRFLSTLPK